MTTDVETLVTAARAGDRDAFAQLVARFQDLAVALCYGQLGDRELARDAAQDAFVDAYLHLGQLQEARAFSSWFRRVLHKHCDRRSRRRRPDAVALEQHLGTERATTQDPELALLADERASWLQAALGRLPAHERIAVALHYLGGQPVNEIGALLEVEPNTIKQRLHSARRRLRERSEEAMRQDIQSWRPSSSAGFSDQVRLFLAVRTGDEATVRSVLARAPELLEATEAWDTGDWPDRDLPVAMRATPLIRAAEGGHTGVVRALLEAGAHVDGGCGCTTRESPLWAAVVMGQHAAAAELLARGADPRRRAASGLGSLHVAAIRGDRALAALLIEHGADREAHDAGGRSAADWARLKGHAELAAWLLDAAPTPKTAAAERSFEAGSFYATGIKALDLFTPIAEGSLVLVQGGAGVGRNVLVAELAEIARRRGDTASVWALWQRETWSDAELAHFLNETRVGDHVHVLRHAHDAGDAAAHELPAQALAACDALIARGARHVQLTFFEREGVRASIEALIPALGRRKDGAAITAFIVPPWQSSGADVRTPAAPFDACIAFDRTLASAMCFPALDAQRSVSRLLHGTPAASAHAASAREASALLAELARDPAQVPADRLERARRLRAYLTQPFHVTEPFSGRPGASVELANLLSDVRAILDGEADRTPIEQLAYRGALAG